MLSKRECDEANEKVGAERNPQKTEVTHNIDDLGVAPLEWKVDDVQRVATVSTVTAGSTTLGVAVERAFDAANVKLGQNETPQKTQVIYDVTDMDAAPPEWTTNDVRPLASVSTAVHGHVTLGVAVAPRQYIADQLLAKADAIRGMHERVRLCQDPQTKFALLRESLGVSRINHILRVHGHTILQAKRAAEVYDEVGPELDTKERETLWLRHT